MFVEIFSILAPIITSVAIGFGWSKSGRSYDIELITDIVTFFGTPCLVFAALSSVDLHPGTIGKMALAALLANIMFIILGAVFLLMARLPLRAYLQTLSFPNVGNIGLPLCFLAFGDEGLALAVAFFAVYAGLQLTAGSAFVAGVFSPGSLLKMPVIPATLLGVGFLVTATPVPLWLYNTTKLIGDFTIPLMLFTLGVSLAGIKVQALKISLLLSVVRLVLGFVVGVFLVFLLGLEGTTAGVVILECSMPAAIFCYLIAQQCNQQPEEVAGVVIVSTFLGFASLPALLWYVL